MAASTPETGVESKGAADFSSPLTDNLPVKGPRGLRNGSDGITPRLLTRLAAAARGPTFGAHTDPYRLRRWFAAFLAWSALLTAAALISFGRYEHGVSAAQAVWLVSVALFYLSLCCVFLPAPTAWIVMLLASNEVGLLESIPLRVLTVSCACGLATAVANLNEYHLLTFLLRYRRVARIRDARTYQLTARWFRAAPFVVIAAVGFLPIPVDVIRWLAITCRYSRWRFFLAYFVGRSPRYALFAASAVWFDLTWWQILVVQAVLVLLAAGKVVHSVHNRRQGRQSAAPGSVSTST